MVDGVSPAAVRLPAEDLGRAASNWGAAVAEVDLPLGTNESEILVHDRVPIRGRHAAAHSDERREVLADLIGADRERAVSVHDRRGGLVELEERVDITGVVALRERGVDELGTVDGHGHEYARALTSRCGE
jgi:hypothetical protein